MDTVAGRIISSGIGPGMADGLKNRKKQNINWARKLLMMLHIKNGIVSRKNLNQVGTCLNRKQKAKASRK